MSSEFPVRLGGSVEQLRTAHRLPGGKFSPGNGDFVGRKWEKYPENVNNVERIIKKTPKNDVFQRIFIDQMWNLFYTCAQV